MFRKLQPNTRSNIQNAIRDAMVELKNPKQVKRS